MPRRSAGGGVLGDGLALLGGALLLVGCQQAMPVVEAKKVPTTFTDVGFVPPPRTVEDVTAILDQEKRADPERTERARARADQAPPGDHGARDPGSVSSRLIDRRRRSERGCTVVFLNHPASRGRVFQKLSAS